MLTAMASQCGGVRSLAESSHVAWPAAEQYFCLKCSYGAICQSFPTATLLFWHHLDIGKHPSLLSYDTTFCCGDFYVSVLLQIMLKDLTMLWQCSNAVNILMYKNAARNDLRPFFSSFVADFEWWYVYFYCSSSLHVT